MNQHLINLAVALAAVELLHNIMESQNVRNKVKWLGLTMDGKAYKDMPFQVDTRAKAYGLSLVTLVVLTAVLYGIFSWISPGPDTALKLIIGLLVLAYLASAVLLDKYHIEIGAITNPLRKKLK